MLNTLANRNADVERLLKKGYAVSIDSSYLVVRDVPYLDHAKALNWGAIVSKLVFVDRDHVRNEDHQIFFCGSVPCELDGTPIRNLGGGPVTLALASPDLVVQRSFSNKPTDGYRDLFDKIDTYVTIVSGPAMTLHHAYPFTFRSVEEQGTSMFKYRDTLTSRAEIGDLSAKFENDVVAVIGLGGTGAYVLDFLVKTPVKEIRGFDPDGFHVHNAFRAPGKLDEAELGKSKAEVYQGRYDNFRSGIDLAATFIAADSTAELTGVTFAFVCVDKGAARAAVVDLLIQMNIPFIDVGMGLDRPQGAISGTLRTTYFSTERAREMLERRLVPTSDPANDVYQNNIQIAELNAMNACLAVIRFKQVRGFYADDVRALHTLFTIDSAHCAHES